MQAQISAQKCFITPTLMHKFQSKKLLSSMCTTNRLVLLTQSQFIIYNPTQSKYKCTLPTEPQTIIRWVVNYNNQLCILYSNGIMQIRCLQCINQVKHRFGNIQLKVGKGFPQLYWQDQDIYVLGQNILQVVNIKKKQRKLYSQLLTLSQGKNMLGLVESRLLDRQRIIIMIFSNKITFNIVPIPITQMLFQQITRFYPLSCPRMIYPFGDQLLPRQYLVIILDNRILRVYNIINMKPLIQIQYQNTGHQFISLTSDRTKQFLLVTFITKKNKVTRNILYKINSKQYYRGKDIFKDNQSFFQFQVELEIKENLMLFTPREVKMDGNDFIAIDVGHIRHNAKRNKGEIFVTTIIITLCNVKKKGIKSCKTRNIQWKQLREWKDIITSYIQMKNTLDKIDFDIDQEEQQQYLPIQKNIQTLQKYIPNQTPKNKVNNSNKNQPKTANASNTKDSTSSKTPNTTIPPQKNSSVLKPVKQPKQMYNLQNFPETNPKLPKQQKQSSKILQQHERQIQLSLQKCEKLKVSLIDGAYKFKAQALNNSNTHEDHQLKLQEQFYKFMAGYLKEQQLDIDTQLLFRRKGEDYQRSLFRDHNCAEQTCNQFCNQHDIQEQIQCESQFKPNKKQNITQVHSGIKQKQQKQLLTSKSSQQLAKNKNTNGSSYLNRTKSSANEQFQPNTTQQKQKNQSNNISIFSQKNRQMLTLTLTKSQQNGGQADCSSSQDSQLDRMALKITQAITKAFSPLQQKFDKLQQHIKRIQNIHVNQLKKCQRAAEREVLQLNNIDMKIKGYCQQILFQFDKNLQNGLKHYWTKIQQIDKKAAKQRNKTVDSFGAFIDQQIKSREQIFDHSRTCIENNLSHLRKKMGNFFTYYDQEQDEDEDQLYQRFKRYKNQSYGFRLDIQDDLENQQQEEQEQQQEQEQEQEQE